MSTKSVAVAEQITLVVDDDGGERRTACTPTVEFADKRPVIGDGPFDLTMIEIGQYDQAWPDWHLGPEQAVEAHRRVRGAVMLPVHWGLFALASHAWTEPIERVLVAARKAGAVVISPRPGQSVEPTVEKPQEHWRPAVPWRTAAENPIVADHAN